MDFPKFSTPLEAVIAAARDFKQLLDIQAPGTLFFPRHKGDARTTATYATASFLLEQATAQNLQAANGIGSERCITLSLAGVVAKQGADVPPNQLQLFAGITAAIAELVLQVLDEHGGSGEHCGSLEVVVRARGKGNVVLEEIESEGNAVHEPASTVVVKQPLCHGTTTGGEVR